MIVSPRRDATDILLYGGVASDEACSTFEKHIRTHTGRIFPEVAADFTFFLFITTQVSKMCYNRVF